MKSYTNLLFLSLPFLTTALPGGRGGTLEIISTNSSTIPLMWTCTSINPTSLIYFSSDNALLASYTTSSAATYAENGATWIDFLSIYANSAPTHAQNWGEFTYPGGCYSGTIPGYYGWCGWISIEPAVPSLGVVWGVWRRDSGMLRRVSVNVMGI
jgi:hypothetical protein